MIALGKVPTLLSTVINITISAGWVKKGQKQFHAKGAKPDAKLAKIRVALCVFASDFAPLREILVSISVVLGVRQRP
jgi:hypothetical protein